MDAAEKTLVDLPRQGSAGGGDANVGRVLAGRYRLLRPLGSGQMAHVYVAEQISMARNVAVKLLRSDVALDEVAVRRFRQEVAAVARLRSPHTIQCFDAGDAGRGGLFIAMELLAGETLRQRLERETFIPAHQVVTIAAQVGASLEEAHDAGILHRDLKPENIYLCSHLSPLSPLVKVLDFGLAKVLDQAIDLNLTGERQTVGTPAYMAPEMAVRQRSVDHRADIYALGVMCFEMLTGARPFAHAATPFAAVMAHIRDPIPRPSRTAEFLPPAVDAVFQTLLAKNAAGRPPRATQVAPLLASALAR